MNVRAESPVRLEQETGAAEDRFVISNVISGYVFGVILNDIYHIPHLIFIFTPQLSAHV